MKDAKGHTRHNQSVHHFKPTVNASLPFDRQLVGGKNIADKFETYTIRWSPGNNCFFWVRES